MNKINYFFAAVYQSIKRRRPDGTPYFNVCLGMTGIILLSLVDVLLFMKDIFHINMVSSSKSVFMFYFIGLAILIGYIIRIVIPLSEIEDTEVDERDVKKYGAIFFACYILSTVFLVLLLILSRQ